MIIELAIGAGLTLAAAYGLRKRRQALAKHDGPSVKKTGGKTKEPKPEPVGPRGLRIDDVLLYGDCELWLAASITLDEEGFVARLFRTPGNDRAEWVMQVDEEARRIGLMNPTTEVPDGRVPQELPIDGMRLSLRKRGHATIAIQGDQLPDTTESCEFVWLGGPGGKLLFVVDFKGGDRLALAGETLGRELFDLLPGG